jgi:hypothetical protein
MPGEGSGQQQGVRGAPGLGGERRRSLPPKACVGSPTCAGARHQRLLRHCGRLCRSAGACMHSGATFTTSPDLQAAMAALAAAAGGGAAGTAARQQAQAQGPQRQQQEQAEGGDQQPGGQAAATGRRALRARRQGFDPVRGLASLLSLPVGAAGAGYQLLQALLQSVKVAVFAPGYQKETTPTRREDSTAMLAPRPWVPKQPSEMRVASFKAGGGGGVAIPR